MYLKKIKKVLEKMSNNLAANVSRDDILLAAEKIEKESLELRSGTGYSVIVEGKPYPPKEIIRVAARIKGLNPDDYNLSGGVSSNRHLEKMGFEIILKNIIPNTNKMKKLTPKEIAKQVLNTLQDFNQNDKIGQWTFIGENKEIAFSSPEGSWDPSVNKGFIFDNGRWRFLMRSIPTIDNGNSYLVLESITNSRQLVNYNLSSNKKLKISNDQLSFYEDYKMTIGKGAKKSNDVKKAFSHFGFNNEGIIAEYNYDDFNKIDFIEKFLDYGEIRQKVKIFLREDSLKNISTRLTNIPLNQILYGPPGTGKTYNTLLRAAEIIENRSIDNYDEAKEIFNQNLSDQIEFITFHQNYSYEDFIQGLRPDTETDGVLTFEKKDGVFKRIADKALKNLNNSEKPNEIKNSFEVAYNKFLKKVREELKESGKFRINKSAHISEIDEEGCIKYNGENWKEGPPNGYKMLLSDLLKLYENDVQSSGDIKEIEDISGKPIQHATYYFEVYKKIKSLLKNQSYSADTIQKKKNYVIIIDEINRANISRVFGELITLIEPDKRSHGAIPLKCTLPSGDDFIVPSNLYIIGTMNTADKSIALLDIALRRRFEFVAMYPEYEINGEDIVDRTILEKINGEIIKLKGHDFQIGHAYFMNENKDLKERMNKKVIPLLLEYFMNDEKEVKGILTNAGLELEENTWPIKVKNSL